MIVDCATGKGYLGLDLGFGLNLLLELRLGLEI